MVIYFFPKKSMGQNFLMNDNIAESEAMHGIGRHVIEIGPGFGMLTKKLCKYAASVIAVEKDPYLFERLKRTIKSRKVRFIKADFFDVADNELELGKNPIVIANVPYNISGKVIEWLSLKGVDALLCLQKEFVDRMVAKPGGRDYSKLSVITSLSFSATRLGDVKKGNFRPMPKVDSSLIYLKPKNMHIDPEAIKMLDLLMQHKKKTVRKAIIDSRYYLKKDKNKIVAMADALKYKEERVFNLAPEVLLSISEEIYAKQKQMS